MDKEKMLECLRKTEKEWEDLTPKKKAKKIISHINDLLEYEDKDEQTREDLRNQIIMLEELDSEEIEDYLDKLNEIIMKNCFENVEKNWDAF